MHEQILLTTLQQQSNPGKIINIEAGKLFLDNCIYAINIHLNPRQQQLQRRIFY